MTGAGAGAGSSCAADTISGAVTITGTGRPVTITGLIQHGTLTLSGNTDGVNLDGSHVSGPVHVESNTGSAPITVAANSVNGSLYCIGNSPAPTDNGSVNTVSGKATSQCAALATRLRGFPRPDEACR